MKKLGFIESRLYRKILEVVPVACADAVIVHRGRFLLGKRKNKPAQGKWWLVGGRVLKGELLQEAVRRKVREEAGLKKFKIKKLLGAKETIFRNSAQGPSSHTINSVFLVEAKSVEVDLGKRQSDLGSLRWFSRIDPRWSSYVKHMLRLAGFG